MTAQGAYKADKHATHTYTHTQPPSPDKHTHTSSSSSSNESGNRRTSGVLVQKALTKTFISDFQYRRLLKKKLLNLCVATSIEFHIFTLVSINVLFSRSQRRRKHQRLFKLSGRGLYCIPGKRTMKNE